MERTHGCYPSSGTAREAGTHSGLEPTAKAARRDLRPAICRLRADFQPRSRRKWHAGALTLADSAGQTCISSVCDSRPAPGRTAQISRRTKNRVGSLLPAAVAFAARLFLPWTEGGR